VLKEQDFKHPQLIFSEDGQEQLVKCIAFINEKRPELEKNFRRQFWKTESWYAEHPKERMKVWTDFAPLSFYFIVEWYDERTNEFKRDYNGGIIFHGSHDGGGNGGAPTFSVNLSPVDGWATHT